MRFLLLIRHAVIIIAPRSNRVPPPAAAPIMIQVLLSIPTPSTIELATKLVAPSVVELISGEVVLPEEEDEVT